MLFFPRRSLVVSACVVILLTIYYLHYAWGLPWLFLWADFPGRLLGVIGLVFIVAAFFSGCATDARHRRTPRPLCWHVLLGSLSIGVILLHADFRLAILIADVWVVFLVGVVTNGFWIAMIDRRITRFTLRRAGCASSLSLLRRRWMMRARDTHGWTHGVPFSSIFFPPFIIKRMPSDTLTVLSGRRWSRFCP